MCYIGWSGQHWLSIHTFFFGKPWPSDFWHFLSLFLDKNTWEILDDFSHGLRKSRTAMSWSSYSWWGHGCWDSWEPSWWNRPASWGSGAESYAWWPEGGQHPKPPEEWSSGRVPPEATEPEASETELTGPGTQRFLEELRDWLEGMHPSLMVYLPVLQENYDTLGQIVRLYVLEDPRKSGSVQLDPLFFDDNQIREEHQKFFTDWFAKSPSKVQQLKAVQEPADRPEVVPDPWLDGGDPWSRSSKPKEFREAEAVEAPKAAEGPEAVEAPEAVESVDLGAPRSEGQTWRSSGWGSATWAPGGWSYSGYSSSPGWSAGWSPGWSQGWSQNYWGSYRYYG